MESFQDLVDATYRVKESAAEFEVRSILTAGEIQRNLVHLSVLSKGNRTAEGAVDEVRRAIKEIQTTAAQLRNLQRELGDFIDYVSQ